MKARISTLSLALLFTAAYAAPLLSSQLRLTPSEVDSMPAHDAGAGTSGIAGIRTTVMSGAPTQDGSYTIRVSVPANTRIQAHTHSDDRTAVVISGVWYFGYGREFASSFNRRKAARLEAPSWLWSSVVDLASTHEAAYLEHCRRYALGSEDR